VYLRTPQIYTVQQRLGIKKQFNTQLSMNFKVE